MDFDKLIQNLEGEMYAAVDSSDRTFLNEKECNYLIGLVHKERQMQEMKEWNL